MGEGQVGEGGRRIVITKTVSHVGVMLQDEFRTETSMKLLGF